MRQVFTMDTWCSINRDQRRQVKAWAANYVEDDANRCCGFELASDGPLAAARFKIIDKFTETQPPRKRTVDVFGVAPCPWPF